MNNICSKASCAQLRLPPAAHLKQLPGQRTPHLQVTSRGLLHRDVIDSTPCVPPCHPVQGPGHPFIPVRSSQEHHSSAGLQPSPWRCPRHRPQSYRVDCPSPGRDIEDLSPACLWPHILLLLPGLSGHHWPWLGER